MHFLISGGTGFVGSRLTEQLLTEGHEVTVLTRNYAAARRRLGAAVSLVRDLDEIDSSRRIDAVVNLAGAGIAEKRWTAARKAVLVQSRLQITRDLVELMRRLEQKPDCFVSASAIGFYGAGGDQALTETSAASNEFSHELCKSWEAEARKAEALSVRTCITRFGIILGKGEGMLQKLLPPFRLGLGGRIGSGQQMMSWVHVDDVLAAIRLLVADEQLAGVFNVTAPNAVSNEVFTRTLARVLGRPRLMPLPAWFVRLMFGEMGDRLLLHGQNVVPARLEETGFTFLYPQLEEALQNSV